MPPVGFEPSIPVKTVPAVTWIVMKKVIIGMKKKRIDTEKENIERGEM
jgi:hypothetical protein